MGSLFRQNLRNELTFQNLTVKELSLRTGIPKATLDCYLGARATMPPADVAVRIALALGVSVEFLVTGDAPPAAENTPPPQSRLVRNLIAEAQKLDESALRYAYAAVRAMAHVQEE